MGERSEGLDLQKLGWLKCHSRVEDSFLVLIAILFLDLLCAALETDSFFCSHVWFPTASSLLQVVG